MSKNFYITTTLPYVNSDPHIGFAMEIIRADIIARYKKFQGFEVFQNTGTDEHGLKIYRKAQEQNVDTQSYVDGYAAKFKGLIELLGLCDDIHFIRTTDSHHKSAAQAFWKKCYDNGDIYKKTYKVKYCVGCELEKTDSELVDGKCPIHPQLEIELIDEENYFFRFSKYQKKLLDLYADNPKFVIPESRLHEIRAFVERGLDDFSISRLKTKMPWGVPVPGDDDQVMYVWFDALVNYISTLGWPEDEETYKKYWEQGMPVQYCGKDNLRQQSAMWQAMLFSAGLTPTQSIIINGFITSGGQKMSKSLGNVINPYDVVQEYGTDALRYFVARELNNFEDSDFTMDRFKDAYNTNLANGLGNFANRVLKMAITHGVTISADDMVTSKNDWLESFEINKAMNDIWNRLQEQDRFVQQQEPFKKVKDPQTKEQALKDIASLLRQLHEIAVSLAPIMPSTSTAILECIAGNKMPDKPLFIRK